MYTIKFADGTMLTNIGLNGNNYISQEKLTEDLFSDSNLKKVIINDGEREETLEDVFLIQLKQYGSEYWFILAEKTPEQKERESLLAEIESQAEAIIELAEIIGGAE